MSGVGSIGEMVFKKITKKIKIAFEGLLSLSISKFSGIYPATMIF